MGDQYIPIGMAEQACIVFGGSRGFLDKIAVSDIKRFETEFRSHINSQGKDILAEVESTTSLKSVEDKLSKFYDDFVTSFTAYATRTTAERRKLMGKMLLGRAAEHQPPNTRH